MKSKKELLKELEVCSGKTIEFTDLFQGDQLFFNFTDGTALRVFIGDHLEFFFHPSNKLPSSAQIK